MFNKELILKLSKQIPTPDGFKFAYGTAGFREKATVLDGVCLRMGMLAGLRAMNTKKAVGLMVTASHNPVADNGLKAVDPDGGMLDQSWEKYATELVNCKEEEVPTQFERIAKSVGIVADDVNDKATVFIGRDTRPHSEHLCKIAIQGIESIGATVIDIGIVTTPQLHHCVRSQNIPEEKSLASVDGYYKKLTQAYLTLISQASSESIADPFVVDGAYGVGGPKFIDLLKAVNTKKKEVNCQEVRNSPTGEANKAEEEASKLNNGVGAEHVQKKLKFPENTVKLPSENGLRFTSFDGDADRIVYFRSINEGELNLFDGDKIACLLTMFIQKQFEQLPDELKAGVKFGCVQTAYANGASAKYINNVLKVEAPLTKTGVKYLHHKAVEYDIGVYFEANGHGTVLFKQPLIKKIKIAIGNGALKTEKEELAAKNILALEQLINQATGDAMADCLCVEAILLVENMSMNDWDNIYKDLPSRQLKCQVEDRNIIKTIPDETRVLEPKTLQDAIDTAVAKYENGRAFCRPSGTEDAVRVYAEASTKEMADELALTVAQAIFDHAGGVGERPTKKAKN